MPYPVLPPEPPAILKSLPPEQLPHAATVPFRVLTSTDRGNITTTKLATSTQPETAALILLPSNSAKNAAPLSSPLSVESPVVTPRSSVEESLMDWKNRTWERDRNLQTVQPSTVPTPTPTHQAQASPNSRPNDVLPDLEQPPQEQQPVFPEPLQQPSSPEPEIFPPDRTAPASPPIETRPQLAVKIPTIGHMAPASVPIQAGTQAQAPSSTAAPSPPSPPAGVLEIVADQQQFNDQLRIFTAEGNVSLRFQGALIEANRVQGNLNNFITVAEGDASLRRGQQVFRGDRFVYNFVQNSGTIQNASGTVFSGTSGTDLTFTAPTGGFTTPVTERPLSDRLIENQPPAQITPTGGFNLAIGSRGFNRAGQINNIRFEAEQVEFYPRGWTATNVRTTNDPFSPPELEIRADRATFRQISPLRDEIVFKNQRLVFDQWLSLPTFQRRVVIDRREREPPIVQIRYDGEDRGGLYLERTFDVIDTERARVSVTPQFLVQRTLTELGGNIFNPAAWGARIRASATLSPRTTVEAGAVTPTFFLNEIPNKSRASLRLRHVIGTTLPHTVTLEYAYRNRFFNGSLRDQTVRSSLGGVITSPDIRLGVTGLILNYQTGVQYINADTDRLDLLDFGPPDFVLEDTRTVLGRFQTSASLRRPTILWRGQPLPATPTEGLKYSPFPIVPYIQLVPSVTGTSSYYTNGDSQNTLSGTLALQGQFGHFSRPFLDYTGFNIAYTQVFRDGLSPFFFDRVVDTKVLSFGITQQIYGPLRFGFQTAINLDTGENISTTISLEYSRRTYGVTLRFNPQREEGGVFLRITEFNWTGGSEEFGGSGFRYVDTGVTQD